MNRITTRQQRKKRISAKVRGTNDRPRLSVFRSNTAISAQIIDDASGKTLIGITQAKLTTKGTKTEKAKELGRQLALIALEKKITKVIFDKGLYKYHGRVKAFADGAREKGLIF